MKVGALLLVALAAGLLAAAPAVEARGLLQSATCASTISKCTPGQCSSLQGGPRLVCNRCLNNYAPVTRVINGAKYIVQCVCPKGTYSWGNRCLNCPTGAFCTGGDYIDSPNAGLGSVSNCSTDGIITTRGTGSQSSSSCVAPAGYIINSFSQLGSSATAVVCRAGTYAPAFNRLQACVKCQAGLAENPADGLGTAAKPRSDINTVCKVPPGKWYSQNVVKTCAAGLYRGGFVGFKDPLAASCTSCPTGITTLQAGSSDRANCSRLLPGYGVTTASQPIIPGNISTNPLSAQDLTTASGADACAVGYYSSLTYNLCVPCPYGTTTRANQSTSISDCQIPPGYIVVNGAMTQCGDGTFRSGWLSWNSTATCTTCGTNVNSTATDADEDPRIVNGLVRASPASCYIPAGWEVTYNRVSQTWSARACPPNTYGVADVFYGLYTGLVQVPCKSCPRGMVTDPPGKVANNDSDACTNPAGFGYSSEGATPCAPGFWAAYNSKLPCQQCANGRTTVDDTTQQTSVLACTVQAGYGISATDATAAGTNTTAQVLAPVTVCDVGFYQPSNTTLNATCIQCTAGTSTSANAASTCDVCTAGYGRPGGSGSCAQCSAGSYARTGDTTCTNCTTTDFYDVQGVKTYTSSGVTTFAGATGSEFCVPAASQVAQDAGQLISVAALTSGKSTPAASNAAACIAACGPNKCCIAAWTNSSSSCALTTFTPVNATVAALPLLQQILYKLPPSDRVAASSIGAKVMSSGIYAQCQLAASDVATNIGTDLLVTINGDGSLTLSPYKGTNNFYTTASLKTCKDACDGSPLCWGFGYDGTKCYFRGGEDALGVNTFFVLPTQAYLLTYNW